MLRRLETFARVDGRRLMDIYREDNIENTDYFYPDMKDKAQAQARVEQDFLHYLETDFFSKPGNTYWVLEENGVWVSALRLTELSPGTTTWRPSRPIRTSGGRGAPPACWRRS